jgi:hypothetical protein
MRKGFRYQGSFECSFCGAKLRSRQGLFGHIQLKHGPEALQEWIASERAERQKASGGVPLPDTKALKTELEALELEEKLSALKAKQADRAARVPDLSEMAGLGPMQPEIAREVQGRAFGAPQPQPPRFDLMSLLTSSNLPVILSALKGALGVGQGDSVASVLKDMGLSLPDLIRAAVSPPKRVDGLVLGGVDLSGVSLTPEMFGSILQYKASEEKVKLENESRKEMTESVNRLVTLLTPLMAERLGVKKEAGGSVSRKGEESEILTCPLCNRENSVPYNISAGQVIHCGTEGCQQSWTAESARAERPAAKKKRQAKVREPDPVTISCPGCKQSIDVSGKPIGTEIRCPVCDTEVKIVSEDEPVPAAEPLTHLEKSQRDSAGKQPRNWRPGRLN